MAEIPRPVFIYGTLCAKPLLAWVLTGNAAHVDKITTLLSPAKVENVARYSLHGCDYPAAIKEDGSSIHGYILQPKTLSQRRKLDDFAGEVYKVETVQAIQLGDDGEKVEGVVQADIYLWNGDKDMVSNEAWDFEWFIRERLEDWIDLFEGMEMVGGDEDD